MISHLVMIISTLVWIIFSFTHEKNSMESWICLAIANIYICGSLIKSDK